jgi:outer membrane receptor protein involved in Fe transport
LEVILNGVFDEGWRWGGSYRFEIVHDDFAPVAQNGADYVDYERTTPQHLIKLNLGWSGGRWELDGYTNYQSQMFGVVPGPPLAATTEVNIPGYVSVDARAGYRLTKGITASISGQNILSSHQQQTTGPDVERRILLSLSVAY